MENNFTKDQERHRKEFDKFWKKFCGYPTNILILKRLGQT